MLHQTIELPMKLSGLAEIHGWILGWGDDEVLKPRKLASQSAIL